MPPTRYLFLPSHHDDREETASIGTRSKRCRRNDNLMGVMPRKLGDNFIITSDRSAGELPSKQAPKRRSSDVYQVWTGHGWSATMTDAKTFTAIDVADEYIRANYVQVMG